MIAYDNPTSVNGDVILCKNLKLIIFIPGNTNIPAGGA